MIDKDRFKTLWEAIVVQSRADRSKADDSPLSISNGISDRLRNYLLTNMGEDGECVARDFLVSWRSTPQN